jgi:hypothetical protein
MNAEPQKQGSACVPKFVPAKRNETCTSQQRLEVAVHNVLSV